MTLKEATEVARRYYTTKQQKESPYKVGQKILWRPGDKEDQEDQIVPLLRCIQESEAVDLLSADEHLDQLDTEFPCQEENQRRSYPDADVA